MNARIVRGAIGTVAVALVVGGFTMSDADEPDQITATIKDAGQLEVGAEVRTSGVIVGEVADIKLVGRRAKLTIEVQKGVLPLHTDASLTMRPVNVLGENFIDLDPGSDSAPFSRSSVIAGNRVTTAPTVQDLFDTFDQPTAAGLASLVTTLGVGLEDNGAEVAKAMKLLTPAMQDSARLGDILSEQNQVLANLIAAADPIAASIADDDGQTLDSLLTSTHDTLRALTSKQEALEATLRELPDTLTSADKTLKRFGATAEAGAPTVHALRPLTDDLDDVVEELDEFAESADPALDSLTPVLQEADVLLDDAAPVVAQLRKSGPDLAQTAESLKPVSRQLLDEHLQDVMDFVRKWALSTNGRDGLSHYFRGVVYVTPTTLQAIAESLIPLGTGAAVPATAEAKTAPAEGAPELPDVLPGLPDVGDTVDGVTGGAGDLVGGVVGGVTGILGGQPKSGSKASSTDPASSMGLTAEQERNLLGQILGGGK